MEWDDQASSFLCDAAIDAGQERVDTDEVAVDEGAGRRSYMLTNRSSYANRSSILRSSSFSESSDFR